MQSSNSLKIMKASRIKDLKVVTYKNKYFPQDCIGKKSQLINQLLKEERICLKINVDIDPEVENAIADQVREDILKVTKGNLFYNYDKKKVKKPKSSVVQAFPTIGKHNMRNYISLLSNEKKMSSCEKSLKLCCDHMHTSAKPSWTSPSSIMKAVNHCLLTRNWNNLTHITLFLINLPTDRYKPLIRHLCQIIDKLHPIVQENELQGQLMLANQANRNRAKGNISVVKTEL